MNTRTLYRFEEYELEAESLRLSRNGEPIPAEPQVIMLLVLLVRNSGKTVSKTDINDIVWEGRTVSPSALTSRLRSARALIDDDGSRQRLIRTIPNVGLRFVGDVKTVTLGGSRFATTRSWIAEHRIVVSLAAMVSLVLSVAGITAMRMLPQDLRTQFEVTRNAAIQGHNTRPLQRLSLEDCLRACLSETEFICRSVDFSSSRGSCDLSNVSAENVGGLKDDYYRNPYDHYARKDLAEGGVQSPPQP